MCSIHVSCTVCEIELPVVMEDGFVLSTSKLFNELSCNDSEVRSCHVPSCTSAASSIESVSRRQQETTIFAELLEFI